MWGKLYGQWIAGAAVFVFDHEKVLGRQDFAHDREISHHLVLRSAHSISVSLFTKILKITTSVRLLIAPQLARL